MLKLKKVRSYQYKKCFWSWRQHYWRSKEVSSRCWWRNNRFSKFSFILFIYSYFYW